MTPLQPQEIEQLAPMSNSVHRLAKLVSDPDTPVADITRVVELDEALTSNLLRWANSAWSRSQNPVHTVREAVIRVGAGNILKMTVGEKVRRSLGQASPAYALDEHQLWRHSVAAALAAESLHLFTDHPVSGAAFTAALVHDIGKLVLGRHLDAEALREIRRLMDEEKLTYIEAEFRVLGTDHAKVGGLVARHWQFPETLVRAIELHHDPDASPDPVLDTVHVANLVAKLIGEGLGSEELNLRASSEAPRRLGLSSSGLESLCAQVQTELDRAESAWKGE
jgi:putative nucleotidyltransferase with HDIG domain